MSQQKKPQKTKTTNRKNPQHPGFHFHILFSSHNERMAELYGLNSQDDWPLLIIRYFCYLENMNFSYHGICTNNAKNWPFYFPVSRRHYFLEPGWRQAQESAPGPRRQLYPFLASLQTAQLNPWTAASHPNQAVWNQHLPFVPSSPLVFRMKKERSQGCLQNRSQFHLVSRAHSSTWNTLNDVLYYEPLLNCGVDFWFGKMAPHIEITQTAIKFN